jgi:hypothetical protein
MKPYKPPKSGQEDKTKKTLPFACGREVPWAQQEEARLRQEAEDRLEVRRAGRKTEKEEREERREEERKTQEKAEHEVCSSCYLQSPLWFLRFDADK